MATYTLGLTPVPDSSVLMKRYGMSIGSYLLVEPDGLLLAMVEEGSPLGRIGF